MFQEVFFPVRLTLKYRVLQLRIYFHEISAFPLPLPVLSSFVTPENEVWYIPEDCSKIHIQQLPTSASAALMNPFKPPVQCSRCL